MMLLTDSYPVFEADQVLSQKHLNQLIDYLDEQDRVSRIRLLGMGIVCGLEIDRPNPNTVHVSCGTAITSLGYMIPLEDTTFTHYKETTLSENFLSPVIEAPSPHLEKLYEHSTLYQPFENCLELLEKDDEDDGKKLLDEETLKNKAVMLLAEVSLIDEKNCIDIGCDDKGKRLEFNIRPLLIHLEELQESKLYLKGCNKLHFDSLTLPRYNVPKGSLITTADVLNAYNSLIKKSKVPLNDAIKNIHEYFESVFGDLGNYTTLQNALGKLNDVHSENEDGIYLQYVWDWITDLASTYNEIAQYQACNESVCCPEEDKFPFHVVLGSAEFSTKDLFPESDLLGFRTPLIKTGIVGEGEQEHKQILKGLIEKLIQQVNTFDLSIEAVKAKGIKITPSCIGKAPLSEQAIPFYYAQIAQLNEKWSPSLTQKNQQKTILGYHSDQYASTPLVNDPLSYDLEDYDFFRIEGHIGTDSSEAITEIIAQQQNYRLPFKVLALNAVSFTDKTIDISKQTEVWDDMELDYDLAKEKVYNITEYVITWIKSNKDKIQEHYPLMTDINITTLESILVETRELLPEDLADFLPIYESFHEVFENLNDLFLSHRACISSSSVNEVAIMEDFVDHMDEINNLFLANAFTIIHEEATRRWQNVFKETFLSTFLGKHPGITHKAGVPKGGTFVLVYADSNVFQAEKASISYQNLSSRIAAYNNNFGFTEIQKKEIQSKNVVREKVVAKHMNTDVSKEYIQRDLMTKNYVLEAAKKEMYNFPEATRKFVEVQLNKAFDSRLVPSTVFKNDDVQNTDRNIPERVIIADFYLPYICCSNGNNINIVLNNTEPKVADFGGADFDNKDFFTNDK